MIGATYKSAAVQAVLGPGHSSVIPDVLWSGWLDSGLSVLGMTGLTVSHDSFGEVTDGVANTVEIDGGLAPAGTITHFGLFDAASSGNLIAYAPVTFASTPAEDDPLLFAVGDLTFTYTEA